MTTIRVLMASTLIATVGCRESSGPVICADIALPAVAVSIRDDETGDPAAQGSKLYVLRNGTGEVVDSASSSAAGALILLAAFEVSGRLDVIVEKPAYFPWLATVDVREGRCNVETRNLEARLLRRP